jgi:tRNA G18 (ribose-2'-O)-methylase SpoU
MEDRYLVLNNISKKNNLQNLCATAGAFDFTVVFTSPSQAQELHLSPLLEKGLRTMTFNNLSEAKLYLTSRNVPLVGIEIMEEALPLKGFPFAESDFRIAVMPGNEGTGLNSKQKGVCDKFVYIPQYGLGTASLNVNVATSLVLNQFSMFL